MKAVVSAFNQEKALVGAFSVITNLRMELFQALSWILSGSWSIVWECETAVIICHQPDGEGEACFLSYVILCVLCCRRRPKRLLDASFIISNISQAVWTPNLIFKPIQISNVAEVWSYSFLTKLFLDFPVSVEDQYLSSNFATIARNPRVHSVARLGGGGHD